MNKEFDPYLGFSVKGIRHGITIVVSFWFIVLTLLGVVGSYPTMYLTEYWIAQWRGCSIPINNPIVRTGGGLGGVLLIAPIVAAGITKGIDNAITDDIPARGKECSK